ncbi:B3 domain-containing protein [Artemisia annua]|uniref:B3 domain-containing protein n=1 Tax=Artemisia annua TaxID=35608 RepID=A0A2U1MDL2_ARTAN|nr:B3 domain-containing protein [Artemisia annua]
MEFLLIIAVMDRLVRLLELVYSSGSVYISDVMHLGFRREVQEEESWLSFLRGWCVYVEDRLAYLDAIIWELELCSNDVSVAQVLVQLRNGDGLVFVDAVMPYAGTGVANHDANGSATHAGNGGMLTSYGTYGSNGAGNHAPNVGVTRVANTVVSISERRYVSNGAVNHRDDRRHITCDRVLLQQLHLFHRELEGLPDSLLISRSLSLLRALIATVEQRIRAYSRNVGDMKRAKPRVIGTEMVEVRRSSRVASLPAPVYKEIAKLFTLYVRSGRKYSYSRKDLGNCVYASDEARDWATTKAEELEANLEGGYPSFVKPMLQSHVTGGFWVFQTTSVEKKLPTNDATVTLIDEEGDEVPTVYLARKAGLSGGWRGFSISHELVDSDALVFQLIERTVFKVISVLIRRMHILAVIMECYSASLSESLGLTNVQLLYESPQRKLEFLTKYLATFFAEDANGTEEAKEVPAYTIIEFIKSFDMFQVSYYLIEFDHQVIIQFVKTLF